MCQLWHKACITIKEIDNARGNFGVWPKLCWMHALFGRALGTYDSTGLYKPALRLIFNRVPIVARSLYH